MCSRSNESFLYMCILGSGETSETTISIVTQSRLSSMMFYGSSTFLTPHFLHSPAPHPYCSLYEVAQTSHWRVELSQTPVILQDHLTQDDNALILIQYLQSVQSCGS